jgi:23S rRNA (cytosine1962-C5)-methyltransferase
MKASRGYKDINLLGIKLLRPGGVLATFSCSGLMTPDLFHKVVADAAVDAKRDIQVIARLQQAEDHPEGLCFPEGLYLKGFLCRAW